MRSVAAEIQRRSAQYDSSSTESALRLLAWWYAPRPSAPGASAAHVQLSACIATEVDSLLACCAMGAFGATDSNSMGVFALVTDPADRGWSDRFKKTFASISLHGDCLEVCEARGQETKAERRFLSERTVALNATTILSSFSAHVLLLQLADSYSVRFRV